MNLNQLTTGTPQAFRKFATGQMVDTQATVEGQYQIAFTRGTIPERWEIDVPMIAGLDAPAIGGQTLHSHQANEILARQIEEFAGNPLYCGLTPVYIQWFAGGSVATTQVPQDGYYLIESLTVDYHDTQFGIIQIKMKVVFLYAESTPPVHTVSMWWGGGSRTTGYTGIATPWQAFPPGGTYSFGTDTTHFVGAETTVPVYLTNGTLPNPIYFQESSTISNWFIGGCHVYDTINTGTYPVPTTTFVNPQWVEVFGRKHVFTGDIWITNGFIALLIQVGQIGIKVYAWDTSGTPQWRQKGTLNCQDNASNNATVIGVNFIMVGPDYVWLRVMLGTSTAQIRLWLMWQRGERTVDIAPQPLTATNTNINALSFSFTNAPKITANESNVVDMPTQGNTNLPPTGTYGWSASFGTLDNLITIFNWQTPPGTAQPNTVGTASIGFGDGATPLINLIKHYALGFLPMTTTNLQSEAETGSLGTGWSTGTTIAGYSGTGEAICASATASGNADLWGTAFIPAVGQYDVWVRVAVSAHTSSTAQWQMGLWDATSSAFVASTTYAPNNAVFTANNTFLWVRVATNVTPTAGHNMQFRVVTTATTDTVLYVDQAVLVPKTSFGTLNNFPQDIWQQYMWQTLFLVNHHA